MNIAGHADERVWLKVVIPKRQWLGFGADFQVFQARVVQSYSEFSTLGPREMRNLLSQGVKKKSSIFLAFPRNYPVQIFRDKLEKGKVACRISCPDWSFCKPRVDEWKEAINDC